MLDKQQQLYQRICDYELDDSSHEFGFLAHLMGANGWGRPMMLGLIATVGIYGYQREKREKQKDLLAFADVARYRFAEEVGPPEKDAVVAAQQLWLIASL
jgi:hypothetical protein